MFSSCNLYGEVLVIISAENVAFLGVKSGLKVLLREKIEILQLCFAVVSTVPDLHCNQVVHFASNL